MTITTMYVYIESEPRLYTVGFYDPQGKWQPESDHADREKAAGRVAYLNGSEIDEDDLHDEHEAHNEREALEVNH